MVFEKLNPLHLDALREISNVGIGHATTALSQLLRCRIDLRVPRVSVSELHEVPEIIGGADKLVAGVYMQIYGAARGNILLIFPKDSMDRLLKMVMPDDDSPARGFLSEDCLSALREIGNILASAYLSAMGQLLGLQMIPSVPSVAFDMAGAIVDYTLTQLGAEGDMTLLLETEFVGEPSVQGQFFVLPDPNSLEILLRAGKVDL